MESGLRKFRITLFGLINAGSTFQRIVNKVLQGLQAFARAYVDDLAIFSRSWPSHLNHVGIVLQRLRKANLNVNVSKSKMGAAEVSYLDTGWAVG